MTCVTCLGLNPSERSRGFMVATFTDPAAIAQTPVSETIISLPIAQNQRLIGPESQGQAVIEIQTLLKQLGYSREIIGGQYGRSTAIAVSQFQSAVGLDADGTVGSTTWEQLLSQQEPQRAASPETSSDTTNQPAKSPLSLKKLLWWVGLAAIPIMVGGGLIYLLRSNGDFQDESELENDGDDEAFTFEEIEAAETSGEPLTNHGSGMKERMSELNRSNLYPESKTDNGYTDPIRHFADPITELTPTQTPAEPLAVEETTRLKKIDIVDELIKDLQRSDPARRRQAIWELGQRGDSRAVQPLLTLMSDSDSNQRSLILAALSEIGTQTLKPVNRALAISMQDENPDVRKNAIRDVTRIYDLVAQISHLLHYAVDDPNPEVQETARWALNQLSRIRTLSGADPRGGRHSGEPPPKPSGDRDQSG